MITRLGSARMYLDTCISSALSIKFTRNKIIVISSIQSTNPLSKFQQHCRSSSITSRLGRPQKVLTSSSSRRPRPPSSLTYVSKPLLSNPVLQASECMNQFSYENPTASPRPCAISRSGEVTEHGTRHTLCSANAHRRPEPLLDYCKLT